jgi:Holliday junction resolvase-like predicted endonuclease
MDRPSPPTLERRRLKPREQGDLGELSAMEWLASKNAKLFLPVLHSPDIDIVAELGGRLHRIEVKTSTYQQRDRWSVLISTRGGNQSWTGLVKHFEPERCDFLFVHVGDGRRWFIPTESSSTASRP